MPYWVLFCRLILMVIVYPQDFKFFFTNGSWSLSPKMVVLYHESLQPCHSCPISFVSRSLAIHLLPFPLPWKICTWNTKNIPKTTQIPTKSFSTVSSTEWHFAFPYSVINLGKDIECFCLAFALVKNISKWDRGSLYKFHPRKKRNASSNLASFHACKRIWIGVLMV